ncbi:RluA family pseudouridine synthase [Candidatus Parcubacteria bacterium]|nr:MAG: RluA family pseudouridine synthase [Candidatus Parcubacteria bacterium]
MQEPRVIYENEDFLAVEKPAGLLVHPATKSSRESTLVDWLIKRYPEIRDVGDDPALRPGIVHRLDRGTSGVMVVAKTRACFEHLKSLFGTGKIMKRYIAVVHGSVRDSHGVVDRPVSLKPGTIRRTVHKGKMEKTALTEYRVLRRVEREGEKYSVLEVWPRTGRTHQIRIHLKSIGHPLVGDPLYGLRGEGGRTSRLMLHAFSLEFADRTGTRFALESSPPEEFAQWFSYPQGGRIGGPPVL